jgi:hypothetical protein
MDEQLVNQENPVVERRDKQKRYREKAAKFSLREDANMAEAKMMENRGCTDICFLFVFLAFLGVMMGLFGYCISNGQIDKVLAPYDQNRHFCGYDGYEEYPYLYLT